ncbi:MlaC/ttg2D family ABC transporter substrate-binding protein [Neisseria montereyensis]|uniref:ABC transporter substrate-binding protein n=1 Tax=Neisseria montereyensis TaxID=2973938 RepID=A0ABT2FF28_9NEIS|nr:ABC transporter substrate-binding protein [Neisseria montereyensis]MCS4534120.1 ABC transporter substrate-binding protein [Neisseria montereyensis]
MNKLATVLLTTPIVIAAPYAAAAQAQLHPAQIQLQQNIESVLKIARNDNLSDQQKIRQIEHYADNYLDYQRIAALAVGLPWRQFSPKQKTDFIAAFKEMMIAMYSRSALLGASTTKVKLLPKLVDNGRNRIDVFTEVQTKNGNRYEVSYQLYKTGSAYKLYNIRVDGVSMVTVYRNQFNDLIKQKGIDGTISTVRAKGLKKADAIKD